MLHGRGTRQVRHVVINVLGNAIPAALHPSLITSLHVAIVETEL